MKSIPCSKIDFHIEKDEQIDKPHTPSWIPRSLSNVEPYLSLQEDPWKIKQTNNLNTKTILIREGYSQEKTKQKWKRKFEQPIKKRKVNEMEEPTETQKSDNEASAETKEKPRKRLRKQILSETDTETTQKLDNEASTKTNEKQQRRLKSNKDFLDCRKRLKRSTNL